MLMFTFAGSRSCHLVFGVGTAMHRVDLEGTFRRRPIRSEGEDEDEEEDGGCTLNRRTELGKQKHSRFHFYLWLVLALDGWLLDFGRPIYALYVSSSFFPLSHPSIGDYCHMAYNVITAFCLLKLLEQSQRPVPKYIQQLLVIFFVMGASLHLVGDSVMHRLVHSGYKLHLPVRANPIMKSLEPQSLVHSFELLDFYDEFLGHQMWYVPLFASYVVYFFGCFGRRLPDKQLSARDWVLMVFSGMFEWYLVTEGQIFVTFICMLFVMCVILFWRTEQGMEMDQNGRFLFLRSLLVLLLVVVWVCYLWEDKQLRMKYPGLLYVPEPWSYASLYIMK